MRTFDRQQAENNLYELIGAFDIKQMYQEWAEESNVTVPFDRIEDSPAYDDAIKGVLRSLVEAEELWWQREAAGARAKLEAEGERVRAIYDSWDGSPETWGNAHQDLLRRLQEEEGWDEDILDDYIKIVIWKGWDGDWETYESAGGWGFEDDGDEANDLCGDLLGDLDWAGIARQV